MPVPPLAVQFLVAGSTHLAALSVGATIAYPSVLLRQLQANDTIVELDLNSSSWIGSLHGIAGIPSIFLPVLMQYKGRKFAFILSCIILMLGWVFTCLAQGITTLYVGESFQGLGTNSVFAVTLLSISEMVEPKYRNTCILMYGTIQAMGITIVSVLGSYLHWRKVGIIMSSPILIALPISCFWPDSPSWLAYKKRFAECKKSFIALRGTDEDSKKELYALLNSHKNEKVQKKTRVNKLKEIFQTIKTRDFRVPALHAFVLMNVLYWTGGMTILIYTSDIMIKASGKSNDTIKLLLNCFYCIGYIISTTLVTYFSSKRVLLFSMSGSALFSFISAIMMYLQSIELVSNESELASYMLVGYMAFFSLGSFGVGFSIASEIMPVKHRGIGGSLYILYTCIFHAISLKAYPYLCVFIHIWGVFIVYGVYGVFSIFFIWIYVPVTKNKTLQEIEYFYNHGSFAKDVIDGNVNAPLVDK